jgi:hypothetical protein
MFSIDGVVSALAILDDGSTIVGKGELNKGSQKMSKRHSSGRRLPCLAV